MRGELSGTVVHHSFHSPEKEKRFFSQPGNSKLLSCAANELLPLQTLISKQWPFVQNNPSQLPPSLYKKMLSFVFQTYFQKSQFSILLLFLNKLICFAITSLVYFLRLKIQIFFLQLWHFSHFALWFNLQNQLSYIPCPTTQRRFLSEDACKGQCDLCAPFALKFSWSFLVNSWSLGTPGIYPWTLKVFQ